MTTSMLPTNDAEVLAEALSDGSRLTPEAARWLLTVQFNVRQQERMRELAALGNERELTAQERSEVERYRRVGTMLTTLHSLARTALKTSARSA